MKAGPRNGDRVGARLNRALHALLEQDRQLAILGQDIADPYGGAFGITRGLSSRYPQRVWPTPISEEATVGVASGLALCGDRVIVELMFGDFIALCADPLINFASHSVTMYGRRLPMSVVIRCPVGGGRGYGPTHSQNLQKHFIGVPDLALYELTPFDDPLPVFHRMFADRRPAILFEDKGLYPATGYDGGRIDDVFSYRVLDRQAGTVMVYADSAPPDAVLLAPGGMTGRALSAMRRALFDHDLLCQLLVPTKLYPVDWEPVLDAVVNAPRIVIAEDGVAGGGWGTEVSHHLHDRLWKRLREPVRLVQPPATVTPAAASLEHTVRVHDSTILHALLTRRSD